MSAEGREGPAAQQREAEGPSRPLHHRSSSVSFCLVRADSGLVRRSLCICRGGGPPAGEPVVEGPCGALTVIHLLSSKRKKPRLPPRLQLPCAGRGPDSLLCDSASTVPEQRYDVKPEITYLAARANVGFRCGRD